MVVKFKEGDVSDSKEVDDDAFIPRDLPELVSCMRPRGRISTYVAVVGEGGTGKSTAIRKAIRALDHFTEEKTRSNNKGDNTKLADKTTEGISSKDEGSTQLAPTEAGFVKRSMKGGRGVVYVEGQDTISGFMRALATNVGFRHTYSILGRVRMTMYSDPLSERPLTKDGIIAEWDAVKVALSRASKLYKAKYGRPAVLVVDAADLIAKADPQLFLKIQSFAKKCADDGDLRFIFVFSDSVALPALLDPGDSAQSRVTELIEVGDISDAEAIRYLKQKHKMPDERANVMVTTITGGRFSLLNKYGESKTPLGELREVLNTTTNSVLVDLKLFPHAPLFQQLLSSPNSSLKIDSAKRLMEKDKIENLLFNNILAFHPNRTVTFNNRHVELCMHGEVENSHWWRHWWWRLGSSMESTLVSHGLNRHEATGTK